MATTLATLRSNLRTELKIDTKKNVWTDDTLDGYINDAYMQVQKDGDYDWRQNIGITQTLTIVGGTAEYALPADFVRITLVMFDGFTLREITKERARQADGKNFPTTTTPNKYYV